MTRTREESPKARAAFEEYYNLGPGRSLQKLAGKSGANVGQLERWSAKYGWPLRVSARQQEEIAAARAAARREAAALARRRLQRAQLLQDAGLTILSKSSLMELDPDSARSLLATAQKLIESGLKNERLELGEATEHITPPKNLEDMTDAELAEYTMRLERDL